MWALRQEVHVGQSAEKVAILTVKPAGAGQHDAPVRTLTGKPGYQPRVQTCGVQRSDIAEARARELGDVVGLHWSLGGKADGIGQEVNVVVPDARSGLQRP